jgi:hypothetical protein
MASFLMFLSTRTTNERVSKMALCDFEHQLLRSICGLDAPRAPTQWGAGVGVAIEALKGGGFLELVITNGELAYQPTAKGRMRAELPLNT